eukprot:gnl/TRDRNA2_/TRDRNA2_139469_c0_seq2.p1 gnl/TRDRNA2_/TRDRNA2_139469_c0~~gnl/TRDRNA2_/TRDRNA2_139469_c0_seq2.p1  ORF type:complete len:136 (-),score=14.06 gnl/TRDRNA2_/TRDRNA2_139469_c0_seq2:160-567(-)
MQQKSAMLGEDFLLQLLESQLHSLVSIIAISNIQGYRSIPCSDARRIYQLHQHRSIPCSDARRIYQLHQPILLVILLRKQHLGRQVLRNNNTSTATARRPPPARHDAKADEQEDLGTAPYVLGYTALIRLPGARV